MLHTEDFSDSSDPLSTHGRIIDDSYGHTVRTLNIFESVSYQTVVENEPSS